MSARGTPPATPDAGVARTVWEGKWLRMRQQGRMWVLLPKGYVPPPG